MTAATSTPTLSQALNRKKRNPLPALLLGIGLLTAVGFALLGYLESRRTEQVVVLTQDVPYGQPIPAEAVAVVEVPLHRPAQLEGITDPNAVIGRYAARNLGASDLAQPGMLMESPPLQPVYPNGVELEVNMVPVPFSVEALGPVTDHDRVNIGFTGADPALCDATLTAVASGTPTQLSPPPDAENPGVRPYACRLVSYARILWIDDAGTAYLELTPYQAQAIWALQASGMPMWGERYGVASDPLPAFDRLDAGQVNREALLAPAPTPQPREDPLVPPAIPGANVPPIPGSQP